MPGRAEFLESIRHRTQAGRYKPTNAPDVAWTPKEEPGESRPIEDPAARFIEELEALGGHGKRVASLDEASEYVLELARERDAKLLLRWDVDELDELGIDAPLGETGVEVVVWRDLADFSGRSQAKRISGSRRPSGLSQRQGPWSWRAARGRVAPLRYCRRPTLPWSP